MVETRATLDAMRSLLAFVLGVLALLTTAVAAPALWTERHVVENSGYVALADPLGRDPQFRIALGQALAEAVLQDAGLSPRARALARPAVLQGAQRLTRLDGFPDAWTETNRRSQALWFADNAKGRTANRLLVDVAPLSSLLVQDLPSAASSVITPPDRLLVEVGGPQERDAVNRLGLLDPWAYWLTAAAVALALLCLLAARRRSTAALALGLGTLVVAGALKIAAVVALPLAADRASASSPLGSHLQDALVSAGSASFDDWLLVLAGIGLVAVVVGGIAGSPAGPGATPEPPCGPSR